MAVGLTKILIIRLSSIGDVLQCMSIIGGLKKQFPDSQIHWVVRSDITSALKMDNRIDKIWSFEKKKGFSGLWAMTKKLKKERFDYVYDAHSNIRSNIIKFQVCPFWKRWLGIAPKFTMRSKERIKRILLFRFRINKFPKPFRGMISFQEPLKRWGVTDFESPMPQWVFEKDVVEKVNRLLPQNKRYVCLVPSAAWEMKRWPVAYWQKLVSLSKYHFVIIGGKADTFCEEIAKIAPERTTNLAGKVSIMGSCYVVHRSAVTISADTGFIHAADLFQKQGIFLVGPTAFGFPTGKQIRIMEEKMPCRPCTKDGRGKCSQTVYKKCMMDISPESVKNTLSQLLSD